MKSFLKEHSYSYAFTFYQDFYYNLSYKYRLKYNYIQYIIVVVCNTKNAPSKLVSTQCANKLPTESL